jgi:ribosomal protein S6E (S10)
VAWPYGAGNLVREITWSDGTVDEVDVSGDLASYAEAAGKFFAIVGAEDLSEQPSRPAHQGRNRVELLLSWMSDMNKNASEHDQRRLVRGHIAPNIGHDSEALTVIAKRAFEEHIDSVKKVNSSYYLRVISWLFSCNPLLK